MTGAVIVPLVATTAMIAALVAAVIGTVDQLQIAVVIAIGDQLRRRRS